MSETEDKIFVEEEVVEKGRDEGFSRAKAARREGRTKCRDMMGNE